MVMASSNESGKMDSIPAGGMGSISDMGSIPASNRSSLLLSNSIVVVSARIRPGISE